MSQKDRLRTLRLTTVPGAPFKLTHPVTHLGPTVSTKAHACTQHTGAATSYKALAFEGGGLTNYVQLWFTVNRCFWCG